MVVIDATILMLLFRPDVAVPTGRRGVPIEHARERIQFLVQQLEKAKTRIAIPTPALSELLVRAGSVASQKIVEDINKYAVFRIEPFDARAAIEVAAMTRAALDRMGNKRGTSSSPWAKIKYDRQIVAIAKVVRATAIYSDDRDIRAIAQTEDIPVIGLADLPLPEQTRQGVLPLESRAPEDANVEFEEDE
jgi:predicted nucleic acid-binding protein